MKSDIEFSDVFKKDYLEEIVTKVENLINHAAPHEKDYHQKVFATHLLKLGIRIQNEDFIQQATHIIDDLSLPHQSDVYCQISDYYLKNEKYKNLIKGQKYVELAFKKWRESLEPRSLKIGEDFFNEDLRLLMALNNYKLTDFYQECKRSVLNFIKSSPINSQPRKFTRIANHLIKVEDKGQIIQYLELADKIVKDSSHTADKTLERNFEQSFPFYLSPQVPQTPFMFGKSLFDLQLAIAKASKDDSLLKSLEKAIEKMEMMKHPTFSSIPRLLIAKVYYEIGARNTALNIINDVLEFLLSEGGEDQNSDLISEQGFSPNIAIRLAEICIELNEKGLAKKVVPLLKEERQDNP